MQEHLPPSPSSLLFLANLISLWEARPPQTHPAPSASQSADAMHPWDGVASGAGVWHPWRGCRGCRFTKPSWAPAAPPAPTLAEGVAEVRHSRDASPPETRRGWRGP